MGSELAFEYNAELKRWVPKGANPADYVTQTNVAPPPTTGYINRPTSAPLAPTSSGEIPPNSPIKTNEPPLSASSHMSPSLSASSSNSPFGNSLSSGKRRGRYVDTFNPGNTGVRPSLPNILPMGELPKQNVSVFTPSKITDQTPAIIPDSTEVLNSQEETKQS